MPAFLSDLWAEPEAFRTLLVAAASLGAVGLNPPVTSPALPNIQATIRAQPEVNTLVLLMTLVAAGLLFVGGILGDTDGRRRILLGALGVLAIANAVGPIVPDGVPFMLDRLASAAAAYTALPFALALVATTYQGLLRATAIGVAYAAYAGGTAIAPVLVTILGPGGPMWPAFLIGAAAAALAFWFARPRARNLAAIAHDDRRYVVTTAIWAFAIVMVTAGLVDLGNRAGAAVRIGLVAMGLALAVAVILWERRHHVGPSGNRVLRRPVAVAIAVGVVVSFAQAAPLFQLPIFFYLVLRYGSVLAALATAPFIIALVIAGPVAGVLLTRFGPRTLVAGGAAAVGLGNVFAATVLGRDVAYAAMIVPLVLIGAGFVIATTVRTAIIFASVSRGLPATAAALNEASVLVGSRIGLAALTALITQRALDVYASTLTGLDPAQQQSAIGAFRDVLVAIGMPGFYQIASSLSPVDVASYIAAIVEAYRESLFGTGLLALAAAPIAWIALGRRDPLTTVWDHLDERPEGAPAAPAAAASD